MRRIRQAMAWAAWSGIFILAIFIGAGLFVLAVSLMGAFVGAFIGGVAGGAGRMFCWVSGVCGGL